MALRLGPLLFLLALVLAAVVESTSFDETRWAVAQLSKVLQGNDGFVGDYIDAEEEMMMGSESTRRTLAQRRRFISYNALKKNQVPCNRRGHSYYNCAKRGRANPYRRGCSRITRCARYTG